MTVGLFLFLKNSFEIAEFGNFCVMVFMNIFSFMFFCWETKFFSFVALLFFFALARAWFLASIPRAWSYEPRVLILFLSFLSWVW